MILTAVFVLAFVHVAVLEEYAVPENLDVDEILKNDRLLKNYVACVVKNVHCTPEGERLRKAIPEALQNECAKCNDRVKEGAKKVANFLIKNKPELWKELEDAFDPKGEYRKKYQEAAEKEGIELPKA